MLPRNLCGQCSIASLQKSYNIARVSPIVSRHYATAPTRLARDRLIKAPKIQFIDVQGAFQGTKSLHQILQSYDPDEHTLVNLTPNREIPTCRLYTRAAVQEMDTKAYNKRREKKSSGSSNDASKVVKECTLNWNCTEHDLQHKLESGRTALKRGNKLDIGIGTKRKRGAKVPLDEVKHALVRRVREICAPLGKEWKASQGNIQTGVLLYYLGTPPKVQPQAEPENAQQSVTEQQQQ